MPVKHVKEITVIILKIFHGISQANLIFLSLIFSVQDINEIDICYSMYSQL